MVERKSFEVVPFPAAQAKRALVEQFIRPAADAAFEFPLCQGDVLEIKAGFQGFGLAGDLTPRRDRFAFPFPKPEEEAQALFRTVQGNQYTVSRYEKVIGKGTFTIDATKKPRRIDFVPSTEKDKTRAMPGIYQLDGDKLTICYAPVGKERPTEFTSREGQTQTLAIWERESKKKP